MQMQTDSTYGHKFFGDQTPPDHAAYHDAETVEWNDGRLDKITRLRMLTDDYCPFWDISYCYGVLKDGSLCEVNLPFHQLRRFKWKQDIVEYAKIDGVFAKGLGIFEAVAGLA